MRRAGRALARLLSRETSSGVFIREIDGLRFVAILSVVLYHLNGFVLLKTGQHRSASWLSIVLDKGAFGVPLFFVISGFVISHPFARSLLQGGSPPGLKRYYLRRVRRLEPPYLINLLLLYGLFVLVKGVDPKALLPHLLASMAYVHDVVYGAFSLVNGVAWSLEIEFQFYVLAPLLIGLFRLRRAWRRGLLLGLMAVTGLVSFIFQGVPRVQLSILGYGHYFLAGFLLADLYIDDWGETPSRDALWDVIAAAAWLVVGGLQFGPRGLQTLSPLAVLVAYCGAFRGRFANWLFRQPGLYVIGGMCYTIYLYHFQIISAVGKLVLPLGWLATLPLGLGILAAAALVVPVVLVISSALFLLCEKPFMRARRVAAEPTVPLAAVAGE